MSLLISILRNCNAEKYAENFKKFNIDAFTLKILNIEDLEIIGIEEIETRKRIIEHVKNLKIPSEKAENIKINKLYINLVLNQMSLHIHRHLANLAIAVNRKDAEICDIKLAPATKCLNDCIHSLEIELDRFEKTITQKEKKKA